jgi:hypothetical protein
VAVPVEEVSNDMLAFLVAATLRGTLDEWGGPDGPVVPLDRLLADRTRFLLRAAGLPAD